MQTAIGAVISKSSVTGLSNVSAGVPGNPFLLNPRKTTWEVVFMIKYMDVFDDIHIFSLTI